MPGPQEVFARGEMLRCARLSESCRVAFGIFQVIGLKYARHAAKTRRSQELRLMEDISLAFQRVESQRRRGVVVQPEYTRGLVKSLTRYFECIGEAVVAAQIDEMVIRYVRDHSASDPEPDPSAFRRFTVEHPLLDELRKADREAHRRFKQRSMFGTGFALIGLALDRRLDA